MKPRIKIGARRDNRGGRGPGALLSLAAFAVLAVVAACDTQVLPEHSPCTPPPPQSSDGTSGGTVLGVSTLLQCERGFVCRPRPYAGKGYTCQKPVCYDDDECAPGYWCRNLDCKIRGEEVCHKLPR